MMNPYISWALLLVVAGGLGWYYNHGPNSRGKAPLKSAAEKVEHITGAKKSKKKAKKSPEPSSTRATKEEPTLTSEPKVQEPEQPGEDIDQNEMAQRFAAVKSGLPQASTKGSKAQKKNKKAAAANQLDASHSELSTRTASTNGADADDDLSPVESPVANTSVPSAGYVSDMLEAPTPGASVLRVTGAVENEPKKQKAQSFKPVETKKQRQQRVKNEARKQQVQEAEAERRKLLEKQLHLAREAERREAAKSKPTAPSTNAWQTNAPANATNGNSKPEQTPQVDLLDTFDGDAAPTKPATASSSKWAQSLPSEEEQIRLLQRDDEWTTVPSKKQPKKKSDKADESQSDVSASETHSAPVPAPVASKPKVTVTPTYLPDILRAKQKGHPLDSDWAA